ncbi:SET domain-containing protein [Durotheca rogersii]|uniref:SET domain-containing protein n=1 Tax=Durotheca rogersii TaxID=419775 RepID=UPI0022201D89|nr:SET domain-containing protein [Durotheca rogersii]KAI5856722.1 SET domain-containing protein [Durotheca rogersii]
MYSRTSLYSVFIRALFLSLFNVRLCAALYGRDAASVRQCPLDMPPGLQRQALLGCPRPIDDRTTYGPIDWSPWTYPPMCLQTDESPATKYCVLTNPRFGTQGISIITTPETAANCIDMLNGVDHSPLSNASCEAASRIVDIPGKGKGVVATRNIGRAEVIMADWASLLVDLDFPTRVRRTRGYTLLHKAVDQLPDPDRVLQLARSSAYSADIIEDVLRTNSFSYSFAGEPHMALYPNIARVNHACRPNAFVRFTPISLAVSLVALRDIEAGEEINITYIPLGTARNERQAALRKWGFNCTCSLCTASKTEIAASDYRRNKIKALGEEVIQAIEVWDGTKAVKLTQEVLDLMRIEGLVPLYSGQYEIMARLYWKAKDVKTATEYARMSLDTLVDLGYLEENPEALPALLKTFDV